MVIFYIVVFDERFFLVVCVGYMMKGGLWMVYIVLFYENEFGNLK